jgi:hypothetical protein
MIFLVAVWRPDYMHNAVAAVRLLLWILVRDRKAGTEPRIMP